MNWYLLGFAIAIIVSMIIANIYFLAHYAHPNDTWFGRSIPMRILVVPFYLNSFRFLVLQSAISQFLW